MKFIPVYWYDGFYKNKKPSMESSKFEKEMKKSYYKEVVCCIYGQI
jgi:hypothetical protein